MEDPVDLVEPESHQLLRGAEGAVGHEEDARDDAGEVAKVEDVVALGRRRQEGRGGPLVHLPRRLHHGLWEEEGEEREVFGWIGISSGVLFQDISLSGRIFFWWGSGYIAIFEWTEKDDLEINSDGR